MNGERPKRLGAGTLTALAVLIVTDFAPSILPLSSVDVPIVGTFFYWQTLKSATFMFIAASAGAYVARVNFIRVAVLLTILSWVMAIQLLNTITTSFGQGDIAGIALSTLPSLLLSLMAAVFGASLGHRLAHRNREHASVAT